MTISEYCYRMVWKVGFQPDIGNIIKQYMEIFRCRTMREVEDDFKYYLKDQENARIGRQPAS